MGGRSNRAWTGSLQALILSLETEMRPRPLDTFPARNQEVDLSSRLLCTFHATGELACREALTTGTQERVDILGVLTEANESQEEQAPAREN